MTFRWWLFFEDGVQLSEIIHGLEQARVLQLQIRKQRLKCSALVELAWMQTLHGAHGRLHRRTVCMNAMHVDDSVWELDPLHLRFSSKGNKMAGKRQKHPARNLRSISKLNYFTSLVTAVFIIQQLHSSPSEWKTLMYFNHMVICDTRMENFSENPAVPTLMKWNAWIHRCIRLQPSNGWRRVTKIKTRKHAAKSRWVDFTTLQKEKLKRNGNTSWGGNDTWRRILHWWIYYCRSNIKWRWRWNDMGFPGPLFEFAWLWR